MTSPYLERPLRSLEEAKRSPRNWGVPPQPKAPAPEPVKLEAADKAIILLMSASLGFATGILFLLAYLPR